MKKQSEIDLKKKKENQRNDYNMQIHKSSIIDGELTVEQQTWLKRYEEYNRNLDLDKEEKDFTKWKEYNILSVKEIVNEFHKIPKIYDVPMVSSERERHLMILKEFIDQGMIVDTKIIC